MKIAFTTLACPSWDLNRVIQAGVEYGYDGIDFRGYRGHIPLFELPEFTSCAAETASRVRQAGLEIPCLSSSAKLVSENAQFQIDEVERYADMAETMKVPMVRIFGGAIKDRTWPAAIDEALGVLDAMSQVAGRHGVALMMETHDSWTQTDPVKELMVRIQTDNVGVLWDVHHPLQMAKEPLETTWANIGKWVAYTHFKDSRLNDKGEPQYCLPGEGEVPLDRIVRILADGGYDGYLTVEWEKQWHKEIAEPEVALPAYARALRQAIANAR